MNLHALPSVTEKSKRRVGRGYGSGRGKTAGRGQKGQLARNSVLLSFEGGALPLIKRLPFRRGKGRNKVFRAKPYTISISALNNLPAKTVVDKEALVKHNIVAKEVADIYDIKVLSSGDLSKALTVKLQVTASARKQIEKAGGSVA